jgi:hypothetical protein
MRSVQNVFHAFAISSFADELAHRPAAIPSNTCWTDRAGCRSILPPAA